MARSVDPIPSILPVLSWSVASVLAVWAWIAHGSPLQSLGVWLAALSLSTATVFAFDKHRARTKQRRVSERALFLLMASGGALGALLAMLVFRHKTKHTAFWVVVMLALAVHAGLVVAVVTQL